MLVAGQWDPKVIGPMADKPLWLITSTGDAKSTGGAETALVLWAKAGAKEAMAKWNFDADPHDADIDSLLSRDATIRYTQLQGGWHNGTWRVAYSYKGIRDWLFCQHK